MQAAGTLRDADIMVVMTGDEERPGSPIAAARRDLIEAGRWADVALEYENLATEDGRDFGTVARRSATSWTLTTHGRSGHSSGVFGDELGYGAIYEMARILDAFRRELAEPNLTYNVGVIGGGTPASDRRRGAARRRIGQDQHHRRNRDRPRRPARADPRAGGAGAGADAGDRRPASGADRGRAGLFRGRLSADGADRGQSGAARAAQPGQPRPRPRRNARI